MSDFIHPWYQPHRGAKENVPVPSNQLVLLTGFQLFYAFAPRWEEELRHTLFTHKYTHLLGKQNITSKQFIQTVSPLTTSVYHVLHNYPCNICTYTPNMLRTKIGNTQVALKAIKFATHNHESASCRSLITGDPSKGFQ